METWHYVAIGAVVVIGGVWYVRRRNRAKAAQGWSKKQIEGVAAYKRLKAAGIKTAADPIDYTEALSVREDVKPTGMGAGGAVALSRSLY